MDSERKLLYFCHFDKVAGGIGQLSTDTTSTNPKPSNLIWTVGAKPAVIVLDTLTRLVVIFRHAKSNKMKQTTRSRKLSCFSLKANVGLYDADALWYIDVLSR